MGSISAKNKEILAAVELQADKHERLVARETGIARPVVHERLQELQQSGVIKKVPLLSAVRLGYVEHVFYLNVPEAGARNKLLDLLVRSESVSWIVKFIEEGRFGICFRAKYFYQLAEALENVLLGFEKEIKEKEYMVRTRFFLLGRGGYLSPSQSTSDSIALRNAVAPAHISAAEKKLVEILGTQQMLDVEEISKRVQMSSEEVEKGLASLRLKGILVGEMYEVDSHEMGYKSYKVFLSVRGIGPAVNQKMLSFAEAHPSVWYIAQSFGSADYELGIDIAEKEGSAGFLRDLEKAVEGIHVQVRLYEVERYLKRESYSF